MKSHKCSLFIYSARKNPETWSCRIFEYLLAEYLEMSCFIALALTLYFVGVNLPPMYGEVGMKAL